MLTDADIGCIKDGDSVKDYCIDATPLLEEHCCKTKQKWMPHCSVFQL